MHLYRVRDWYFKNGIKARVMYIRAENSRKARQVFVETNPSLYEMRVWYLDPRVYEVDEVPASWNVDVRGYSEWLDLDYFGSVTLDLEKSEFLPFKTRREKIDELFRTK